MTAGGSVVNILLNFLLSVSNPIYPLVFLLLRFRPLYGPGACAASVGPTILNCQANRWD